MRIKTWNRNEKRYADEVEFYSDEVEHITPILFKDGAGQAIKGSRVQVRGLPAFVVCKTPTEVRHLLDSDEATMAGDVNDFAEVLEGTEPGLVTEINHPVEASDDETTEEIFEED